MRIRAGFSVRCDRIKGNSGMSGRCVHLANFRVQLILCISLYYKRNQLFHDLVICKRCFSHQLLLMLILYHSDIIHNHGTIKELASCA